ncbi:MAG: mannitol-1-phosphate 5-dehydrogenase [bacterium]
MIPRSQVRLAQQRARRTLQEAGIVLTPSEASHIEAADFGLNELERTGLELVTYTPMPTPLYLHFGAGNIGRSLAGALFARGGYDVLFVDALPDVVAALQAKRSYRVVVKDEIPPGAPAEYLIEHVDGIAAQDADAVTAAVARADVIGTSVGAGVLPRVLAAMVPGLQRRTRPVSIILCENLHHAAAVARDMLRQHLPPDFPLAERVGLVETSIGKMVPLMPADVRARDPLEVWGEAYNRIIADRDGFLGLPPQVEGVDLKPHFAAYVDRKLYIHNLGHAVCACEGFLRGHHFIWQAVSDPAVAAIVVAAMEAAASALARKYPGVLYAADLQAHVADLLRRFGNRALGDTVFRVGRDLPRKLAPGDRFIGALRLMQATGGNLATICRGTAAAFHFAAVDEHGKPFPADEAFRAQVAQQGVRQVLAEHCQLDPKRDAAVMDRIEEDYRLLL